jgi:thiamine-monophosphate kinase
MQRNGDEFDLIESLTKRLRTKRDDVIRGAGDDCACVTIGGELLLISNDEMRENVHFKRDFPPRGVGFKLIAANASDILACGGVPKWINLSIGAPEDLDTNWLFELYDGINEALVKFNVAATGGNLTRSDRIQLGGAIFGTTKRFIARGGAKVGDDLWLTAPLGNSRLGLEALLRGDRGDAAINSHLYPKLAFELSELIAKFAASAIDISDGFLGDIAHLMKASGAGFVIDNPQALISQETLNRIGDFDKALDFALNSGEEYQALFTAPRKKREVFMDAGGILLGSVTRSKTLLIGGKSYKPRGFSHF